MINIMSKNVLKEKGCFQVLEIIVNNVEAHGVEREAAKETKVNTPASGKNLVMRCKQPRLENDCAR